jgi:hypothetical protein
MDANEGSENAEQGGAPNCPSSSLTTEQEARETIAGGERAGA